MLAPSPEKVVIHQLNGRDEDRLSLHAQADAQSDDIWEDILETAASAENSPFVGMAVTSPGPEGQGEVEPRHPSVGADPDTAGPDEAGLIVAEEPAPGLGGAGGFRKVVPVAAGPMRDPSPSQDPSLNFMPVPTNQVYTTLYTPDGGSLSDAQLRNGPKVWQKAAWATLGAIPRGSAMFLPKGTQIGRWLAGSTLWAQHSFEPRMGDDGEWDMPRGAAPVTVIIYDHPEGPWCMIWRTPKGLPGIMMCLIALAPRNESQFQIRRLQGVTFLGHPRGPAYNVKRMEEDAGVLPRPRGADVVRLRYGLVNPRPLIPQQQNGAAEAGALPKKRTKRGGKQRWRWKANQQPASASAPSN